MYLKEFEDLAKKYNCLVKTDINFDGTNYYLYAPNLADYRLATYYPQFQTTEMYTIIGAKQFRKIEDLEYELNTKFKLLKQKRFEKKLNDLEKDFE